MLTTALSFGAGLATVASPCVLPVLPILLGASTMRGGRWRPLAITAGFVFAFAGAALAFGASTRAFGLSADALRTLGVVVLVMLGLVLVAPPRAAAGGWLDDFARRLGDRAGTGPAGGLLLGASLGLLWTPCAGPVLASILALSATAPPGQTAPMLFAYAAGAALPMLAIAHGGQAITRHVRAVARHAGAVRRGFGVAVLATAAAMHWHLDTQAAAWLSRTVSAAPTPTVARATGTAPEFAGLDGWLNGGPQSMAALRGQVVLVDFWTFACVNCLNTLPHVKSLHAKYAAQGLAVVGVHTPEFAFERNPDNVRDAVRRLGIRHPVAMDNAYRTWNAWGVQAWPTLVVVGRDGRIVWRQVGEGGEAALDAAVQRALAAR